MVAGNVGGGGGGGRVCMVCALASGVWNCD